MTKAVDQCQRCGSNIVDEFCTDETCPFSDHKQHCANGWGGYPTGPTTAPIKTRCQCKPEPKLHTVKILWGSKMVRKDLGDEPVEYSFETLAELTAFMAGVDAGDGWLEYEVIED